MQFNPTNYPLVTPVPADTVLLRQSSTGRIKSALVSAVANAASSVQEVDSVAGLKAIATDGLSDGALVIVKGYYEAGDGGGGNFYYDSASASSDNGGTRIEPDDGAGRWIRLFSGPVNIRWFGAIGDGTDTAGDTTAVQNAINTGLTVYFPPSTAASWELGRLTANTSYQQFISDEGRGGARITLTDATTGFIVGNSVSQILDIGFENLSFTGPVGQTMFWSKYLRGITFRNCKATADRFIDLGDGGTLAATTYIFELYECEMHQIASATKHFIRAWNFQGQLDFTNTFVEGQRIAGLDGFNAADNVQSRIDHLIVQGGYFSRFRDNWSFVDARLVNAYWSDHLSELALRNALRIEVTSSTSKNVANVGCEGIQISNCTFIGEGFSVFLKNDRASANMAAIMATGVNCYLSTGDTTDGLFYIEAASEDINTVTLNGLSVKGEPTTGGTSKAVHIVGLQARNVSIDNLMVVGVSGTNWGYGVYIGANNYQVSVGVVEGENIDNYVSDVSTRASVLPTKTLKKTDTLNFGTVNAVTATGVTSAVVGAGVNDEVTVTALDAVAAGVVLSGRVTSANTVTVYATNASAGNIVVGSIDVRITVRSWL